MIPVPDLANNAPKPSADQLLLNVAMPYRAVFFPLGFPVEVRSNSPDILEAAAQSWSKFNSKFEIAPVIIQLGVTSNTKDCPSLPPAPLCRIQEHLVSHIADQYNFVHCDLNSSFAFGWVTEQTSHDTLYLRYHILEASAYSILAATRAAGLHAACVSHHDYGILLCGDSGAGKSSLAFAAARSGWKFTCDDASYLLLGCNERFVVGNCHQFRLRDSGPLLFPELEGRPITPRAAGKPSIEIPTSELPGISTVETAAVQAIIFLNRQQERTPDLISFPKERARTWLRKSLLMTSASAVRQLDAVENLLQAPVYELHYTHLAWAIERLNCLAQQGS
jgi:hypothetical protein